MKRATLAVLAAVCVVVGDAAMAELSPPTVLFSHAEHLARVVDPRCTDCHDASRAELPTPAIRANVCLSCHDVVPRYQPRARHAALTVPVAHTAHAAKVACTDCHATDAKADERTSPPRAAYSRPSTSDACLSCHQERGRGPREVECIACHRRDERRVKPDSHGPEWTLAHGRSAFLFTPHAHGESCTSCHREVGCKQCHETTAPRDHTGLFRVRTHGAASAWDRDRCKTCHETNQCIACHTTTPPPSHQGAWIARHGLMARGRSDESCLTCHRQSSCTECHTGGRR